MIYTHPRIDHQWYCVETIGLEVWCYCNWTCFEMKYRRKLKLDTRPRWNEPVEEFKTFFAGRWWNADEWSKAAMRSLGGQQHYTNDPTYNLKRKKVII